MRIKTKFVTAVTVVSLLASCSSKPRTFVPQLAAAPADPAALDAAVADCRRLLAERKLDSSGRLASGATGAAAGAATLAAGSAAASGAGLYGGMAVLGATVVALPIVAVAGAFGMARVKRAKKERAVAAVLSGCLKDHGFEVQRWVETKKVKHPRPVPTA